ncbi:MAG: SulP family inorganic anion transporter, partial [Bacteroidia bacterium]
TSHKDDHQVYQIELAQEVSFFNKASMRELFDSIPPNSEVIIDYTRSKAIAHDVIELIDEFESKSRSKNITVSKINHKEQKA